MDEGTPTGRAPAPGGMNLGDQVFERLLRERIIFLGTQVDDPMANQICAQLLLLDAEDADRDISIYINSPGGSVTAGLAIYDTMQFLKSDVRTVALGLAASMGQFLLCAGTQGKRFALPHARILMHQPSGGIGGTASDIAIQAENMLWTKRTMQERIAAHTGPDRRADRARLRPGPLVHGRRGHGLRLRRPRGQRRRADPRDRRSEIVTDLTAERALRAPVVHRANELRDQRVQPVQQAVRGAHHLPRRADRRRVGQRRHGSSCCASSRPTPTATSSCTSTHPAARSRR